MRYTLVINPSAEMILARCLEIKFSEQLDEEKFYCYKCEIGTFA